MHGQVMGSSSTPAAPRRAAGVWRCLALVAGALLALLAAVGPASAQVVTRTIYSGTYPSASFDGSDAIGGGAFGSNALQRLDIDQATGTLYAATNDALYKFNANGTSQAFESVGPSTVLAQSFGPEGDLEVDNSGQATQGRIYALPKNGPVNAFLPSGSAVTGTSFPLSGEPTDDVCGAAVDPQGMFWLAGFGSLVQYNPAGEPTGREGRIEPGNYCEVEIDSQGNVYSIDTGQHYVYWYDSSAVGEGDDIRDTGGATTLAIDLSNDDVYVDDASRINRFDSEGNYIESFGMPNAAQSYPGLAASRGVAVNKQTHEVYVANNRSPTGIDIFKPTAVTLPDIDAKAPSTTTSTATFRATIDPDTANGGTPIQDCKFEWTPDFTYTHSAPHQYVGSVPCDQTLPIAEGPTEVSATLSSGIQTAKTYHYRLVVQNENGLPALGADRAFQPAGPPSYSDFAVTNANTDGARVLAQVDPNGGETTFRIEYGKTDAYGQSISGTLRKFTGVQEMNEEIKGLQPSTTYHFRLVVENSNSTITSGDQTFTTFPVDRGGLDSCGNAEARRVTGSQLLLDCRAYELVSARNTGGFDVQADSPGRKPLVAYPRASGRLLYSIHDGTIPGIAGGPTNYGLDPYIASRGMDGWRTRYVGLPAGGTPSLAPFGSPLLGADADLTTFAFGESGGTAICAPCFGDGSTNLPLRLPDGSLIKGMAGTLNPSADPAGEVRKALSEDGSHLVFGSERRFEPLGNDGSVSIYARDLKTGSTQVVSTMPDGSSMTGEPAELDISHDGDRVLVGKLVRTDEAGNEYFDLYMHIGDDPESVVVADTPTGVMFNGMTADGGKVFFTTSDQLAADGDTSPDLFMVEVGPAGVETTRRLSAGTEGTGDTDECQPPAEWNVVAGGPNCGTVAIAGGGGVALEDGTIYFLSPELLDGAGKGIKDQPNLYVARPGQPLSFVATLDSSLVKPGPQPPGHVMDDESFISGLSGPETLAVDQDSGDIYVSERNAGAVGRFSSSGAPKDFPATGSNRITGQNLGGRGENQIAVDSAPASPFKGDLYVVTNSSRLRLYGNDGSKLGELTGFSWVCGVSVDQSSGSVYIGDYPNTIWRFDPISATPEPVTNANFAAPERITASGFAFCNVEADGAGHVYAKDWGSGKTQEFNADDFAATPPTLAGTVVSTTAKALQSDALTSDLYLAEGNQILQRSPSGEPIQVFGTGELSESTGVASDSARGYVYAVNGTGIARFRAETVPYEPIAQPAAVHGVRDPSHRHLDDLQISPDGRYAVFSSTLPLTGYPNAGHSEIYRYDAQKDKVVCVSCALTGVVATSDSYLSSTGLNLTDDGRVFFTTSEQLVLRDTAKKPDVYEWSNGVTQLISTGISKSESSLATASADGRDVFFFTRDKLAANDENASTVRIYDAREQGGAVVSPPRVPCQASDECHGPGTQPAPPPSIGTFRGSGGNVSKKARKKRRRHRRHHRHRRKRHKHKRHSAKKRGRAHRAARGR